MKSTDCQYVGTREQRSRKAKNGLLEVTFVSSGSRAIRSLCPSTLCSSRILFPSFKIVRPSRYTREESIRIHRKNIRISAIRSHDPTRFPVGEYQLAVPPLQPFQRFAQTPNREQLRHFISHWPRAYHGHIAPDLVRVGLTRELVRRFSFCLRIGLAVYKVLPLVCAQTVN